MDILAHVDDMLLVACTRYNDLKSFVSRGPDAVCLSYLILWNSSRSLECVKQHKKEFSCSGVRARSKFAASVREFDDNTILSDFYLMEDAARFVGVSGRVGRPDKRRRTGQHPGAMTHDIKALPTKLRKLVQVRQARSLECFDDSYEHTRTLQTTPTNPPTHTSIPVHNSVISCKIIRNNSVSMMWFWVHRHSAAAIPITKESHHSYRMGSC